MVPPPMFRAGMSRHTPGRLSSFSTTTADARQWAGQDGCASSRSSAGPISATPTSVSTTGSLDAPAPSPGGSGRGCEADMCGVAGAFCQLDGVRLVRTMTDRIGHRGPDADGLVDLSPHAPLQLAHRRLSIID